MASKSNNPRASSQSSNPVASGPGLCANCNFQPRVKNPRTGSYFPFCYNPCSAPKPSLALPTGPNVGGGPNTSTGANTGATSDSSLCSYCKKKPRYRDGDIVHPYCSRLCMSLAKGKGLGTRSIPPPISLYLATSPSKTATTANPIFSANRRDSVAPTNLVNTQNNRFSSYRITPSGPTCKTPGCSSPVYVDPDGAASDYCTKTHREWGVRGCIHCRRAPSNGVGAFCQGCHDGLARWAPMIVRVSRCHDIYKSVASQFRKSWRHETECPKVRAIYKIVSTMENLAKYERYLDQVEAKGKFASQGKSPGNENRRWHGTTRKCNLGDQGVEVFCSDPSCSLCCVIKSSFDLRFFAQNTNWGRFGVGIYTSSASSKSDGYSHNNCSSNWKAMLLNKVVVGRGRKMKANKTTLTEPPAGYDSVLAEPGARLNYDELVVYDNDAIRPSYLVMYDIPQ